MQFRFIAHSVVSCSLPINVVDARRQINWRFKSKPKHKAEATIPTCEAPAAEDYKTVDVSNPVLLGNVLFGE